MIDDRYCPACWRPVSRLPWGVIHGHFDKHPWLKQTCPASHEPYHITISLPIIAQKRADILEQQLIERKISEKRRKKRIFSRTAR